MKKSILFLFVIISLQFSGCGEPFPKEHNYGDRNYSLLNEDGEDVKFPRIIKGHIGVVGYIFTNCPDICPLTTNNMRLIRDKLKEEKIKNVEFVSVSFDPLVDTPERLKTYADLRSIDTPDWHFLTGEEEEIGDFMKQAGILAVIGDSTVISEEETIYYYVHTDRISLVDPDGFVRKDYKGSEIDINEIVEDIKKLGD
ncbi:MAG: hypothetical protein SCALA702_07720 [Melioribacteraceae bacterium]|nr:MAG: hypothetical protein SCALA702_07720 [Melioribacteraceae bacterium]